MWQWLIALLVTLVTPQDTARGLAPMPEPEVRAAPIERVYLPIIATYTPFIEDADVTLYGYATPHRRTYGVAFYNWRAIPEDCENENFWPMVRGQVVDPDMVEACDNGRRLLLIYNEPELDHYAATPQEAARFVRDWAIRWAGPIACCGNFYADGDGAITGLEWFLSFVAESDTTPPIDYIHMHVYETDSVDVGTLQAWRIVADVMALPIIVTEAGTRVGTQYTADDVAPRLPVFLATVEDVLQPVTLMWFSDYLQPGALGGDTPWHVLNLTEIDGTLTVVGEAWQTYTQRSIADDRQTKTPTQ